MTARRLAAAAATVMAVVALTGALTTAPASAARGTLRVSGNVFPNPSGCYHGQYWPLVVENDTNRVATVYDQENCRGDRIGTVEQGESGTFEFGASVYIP
ncbi:MAG: hypothetical protein HOV94_44095 [Saccharothrix sp.]|nr:hypothetical protein [Saccharothrix sp.]